MGGGGAPDELPAWAKKRLLPEERVYFYGAAPGGGCFGGGQPNSWLVVTDSRVLGLSQAPRGGCLGGTKDDSVDIPLQHVSSVKVSSEGGCLSSRRGVLVVSSGTATCTFGIGEQQSTGAASVIHEALRRREHP